jgi:hypothetical protein
LRKYNKKSKKDQGYILIKLKYKREYFNKIKSVAFSIEKSNTTSEVIKNINDDNNRY